MKRLLFVLIICLTLIFSLVSAAYLLKPRKVTLNLADVNSAKSLKSQLFLRGNWGRGLGQFGIDSNGWMPGPMSLATDMEDNLYILDQVNKRIQQFSFQARLLRTIPLDTSTYEDIVVDDNFIYLLDPVVNRLVKKINKAGEVIRIYKIASSIEPISGLFLMDGQVYVEVEHAKLYKIGTIVKADRVNSQAKKSIDGHVVEDFTADAEINKKGEVTANIEGRYPLDSLKIEGLKVFSIVSLDGDNSENLYITLDISENEQLFNQGKDKLLGLVIDLKGRLRSKFYASNDYYTSHFRKITVSSKGTIYQMRTTNKGLEVFKWQ